MDFDVSRTTDRQLALRCVQEQRGNVQTQLAMQGVAPAAGQHARAGTEGSHSRGLDRDAVLPATDRCDAGAEDNVHARLNGIIGESSIEQRAVDDHGLDDSSPMDDFVTCWGNEAVSYTHLTLPTIYSV